MEKAENRLLRRFCAEHTNYARHLGTRLAWQIQAKRMQKKRQDADPVFFYPFMLDILS